MPLDKVPGFGFETVVSYSTSHVSNLITEKKFNKLDFLFLGQIDKYKLTSFCEEVRKKFVHSNVSKAFGYIPGIGIVPGIIHLFKGVQKGYSAAFIARGILEILGLGFFLLIPDLIIKAIREKKEKQAYYAIHPKNIRANWQKEFKTKIENITKAHFSITRPKKRELEKPLPLKSSANSLIDFLKTDANPLIFSDLEKKQSVSSVTHPVTSIVPPAKPVLSGGVADFVMNLHPIKNPNLWPSILFQPKNLWIKPDFDQEGYLSVVQKAKENSFIVSLIAKGVSNAVKDQSLATKWALKKQEIHELFKMHNFVDDSSQVENFVSKLGQLLQISCDPFELDVLKGLVEGLESYQISIRKQASNYIKENGEIENAILICKVLNHLRVCNNALFKTKKLAVLEKLLQTSFNEISAQNMISADSFFITHKEDLLSILEKHNVFASFEEKEEFNNDLLDFLVSHEFYKLTGFLMAENAVEREQLLTKLYKSLLKVCSDSSVVKNAATILIDNIADTFNCQQEAFKKLLLNPVNIFLEEIFTDLSGAFFERPTEILIARASMAYQQYKKNSAGLP